MGRGTSREDLEDVCGEKARHGNKRNLTHSTRSDAGSFTKGMKRRSHGNVEWEEIYGSKCSQMGVVREGS